MLTTAKAAPAGALWIVPVHRIVISDYRYKFLIVGVYTAFIDVAARSHPTSRTVFLNETSLESIMKTKLLAAALIIASATLAAPAFASGYGPAPFYRPTVGAPASQQGQNAQTLAAEAEQARANGAANAYGGVADVSAQSGSHEPVSGPRSVYFGR